jgi:hypothetical protein
MKTIKVEEIPAELKAREFLRTLDLGQGEVVFEEGGRACFVMIPAEALHLRRRAKQELLVLIDGLRRRNPAANSDDVLAELEEVDGREPLAP